uniref:Uncharacterized protein n=1 Tax=Chaetoceros debilis TaxID=122233 RepID=A0A7S3VFA4_9STRA
MGNVIASITGKAPATPAAPMLQPSIAGDLNEIKSIIGRHIASCSPLNSVTDRIIYKRTLQILVNESDASGNTALIGAAFSGHLDICKYLLEECGADLTVKNKIGCSALWIAAGYGHVDVLNYLIQFVKKFDGKKNEQEKGKDGEVDGDGDGDGDDKKLKLELNLYQLLTEGNSSGDTPFLAAVSKGHDEIVKILFAASDAEDGSSSSSSSGDDGYDNDNDNSNGNSNNGNSNNSNSDSNAWKLLSTTNNGGDTPLAVAVGMGFDGPLLHTLLDAEEKLFKNGHDGDGDGNGDQNENENAQIRRRRRPLHSRNSKGLTPLLVACERNFKSIAETLVQRGADLSERDEKNRSPLAIASFCGCIDVVTYLLSIRGGSDNGAGTTDGKLMDLDLNGQDENGCTALWLAARTGNLKMVELLINAGGVDESIENKDGLSPQAAAIKYGKQQVIDFFSSSASSSSSS